MAYDLLTKKVAGRSWARGVEPSMVVGDWATHQFAEQVKKLAPWPAVAVGGAIGLFGIWLLLKWGPAASSRSEDGGAGWDDRRTQEIPRQTMHETVYGHRKAG